MNHFHKEQIIAVHQQFTLTANMSIDQPVVYIIDTSVTDWMLRISRYIQSSEQNNLVSSDWFRLFIDFYSLTLITWHSVYSFTEAVEKNLLSCTKMQPSNFTHACLPHVSDWKGTPEVQFWRYVYKDLGGTPNPSIMLYLHCPWENSCPDLRIKIFHHILDFLYLQWQMWRHMEVCSFVVGSHIFAAFLHLISAFVPSYAHM